MASLLVSDQLPGYIVKIKINGSREWKTLEELEGGQTSR